MIWVGTDDGRVHVTRDGGADLDARREGAPRACRRTPGCPHIEPSRHAAGTAFVVFDNHRRSDWTPYVYRTDDYGRTWTSLATPELRGYALAIDQDPVDPELLFLGTEFGLYVVERRRARAGPSSRSRSPPPRSWTSPIHPARPRPGGRHARPGAVRARRHRGRCARFSADDRSRRPAPLPDRRRRAALGRDRGRRLRLRRRRVPGREPAVRRDPHLLAEPPRAARSRTRRRSATARSACAMSKRLRRRRRRPAPCRRRRPPRARGEEPAAKKERGEGDGRQEPKVDIAVSDGRERSCAVQGAGAARRQPGGLGSAARSAPRVSKAEDAPAEDEEPGGPEVPPGTYTVTCRLPRTRRAASRSRSSPTRGRGTGRGLGGPRGRPPALASAPGRGRGRHVARPAHAGRRRARADARQARREGPARRTTRNATRCPS